MGEKIATLASANINGIKIDIELNEPVINGTQQLVHLQTHNTRFELTRDNFQSFAIGILLAQKKLKKNKGIS